jgi:hypothetical protein
LRLFKFGIPDIQNPRIRISALGDLGVLAREIFRKSG